MVKKDFSMSDILTLGISPCPNDTFIFDAWVNEKLGVSAPRVRCIMEDISTLNELAFKKKLDIVKVSFYAYAMLGRHYHLLNAGGALGRGCGPLIVSASPDMGRRALAEKDVRIAVPGRWTTANLLLSLYQPEVRKKVFMRFEKIMPAVAGGEVDAGVIIHEGRFVFEQYGLGVVEDLGAWWEKTTGYPIPLGAIIAKKSLGADSLAAVEAAVKESLGAALSDPDAPLSFMQRHAGEMETAVMRSHVELYVNEYSLDYGSDGMQAIAHLLKSAEEKGLLEG